MNRLAAILLTASISAGMVLAQTPPAPSAAEEQAKAQEERIRKLEAEMEALKAAQSVPRVEPL